MPTYEYRCKKCGKQFEVFQSFKDKPLAKHEEDQGPLERVFHPRGVVFKGSGWYATDSRPNGSSSKPSSDAGASAPAEAKPKTSEKSGSSAGESSSGESSSKSPKQPKQSKRSEGSKSS